MKTSVMVLFLRSLLIMALLGLFYLAGCNDPAGNHCPDEDYPLYCAQNKACCPKGAPVNCGGKCYSTDSSARRSCSARIDTCYRD